jgi:hypothetical protein
LKRTAFIAVGSLVAAALLDAAIMRRTLPDLVREGDSRSPAPEGGNLR